MKRKKAIPILAVLIAVILGFACTEKNINYIGYHKSINKADSLIINKNYTDALKIYEKLSGIYPHFFRKDLHNATACAILLRDFGKAEKYALRMVGNGYELSDFEKPVFEEFRKQKEWKSFLAKYDKDRNKYLSKLNQEEREKYSQLFVKDQEIASARQNRQASFEEQDEGFVHIEKEMLALIDGYGFPASFINKDTLNVKLFTMFRHICGMRNARMEQEHSLKDILKTALVNGYISPEYYSASLAYRGENYYGDISININYKEKTVTLRPEGNMDEINRRRDSIGLPQLDSVSISQYLMNSWYGKIPFEEIRQKRNEYLEADSTQIAFMNWQEKQLQKVRKQYENKEDDTVFFILPSPGQVRNNWHSY